MFRKQKAVLWPSTGVDDAGNPTYGAAEEINVRWRFKRSHTVNANGEWIAIDASVVVGKVIPLRSKLWKGKLADWNPALENEVMHVLTYGETPDVEARQVSRKVGLGFHAFSPPAAPMSSPKESQRGKSGSSNKRARQTDRRPNRKKVDGQT